MYIIFNKAIFKALMIVNETCDVIGDRVSSLLYGLPEYLVEIELSYQITCERWYNVNINGVIYCTVNYLSCSYYLGQSFLSNIMQILLCLIWSLTLS